MKNSLFKDKPTVVIEEVQEEVYWVNYMDVEVMKTMMKMSGDVFTIAEEEPSDPLKLIMPIIRPINNWTWFGFLRTWGKSFVMQVPMYFSIFSIR